MVDGELVIAASMSAGFATIVDSVGSAMFGCTISDRVRRGGATAGVNVKVVSKALGHSRASFTLDVYKHVLPGTGSRSRRPSNGVCRQSCRHSAVRIAAGHKLASRAHSP